MALRMRLLNAVPTRRAPRHKWPPKVSHRHEYLDSSADVCTVHGFEKSSGGRACAEQVALGSRDLGAQSMYKPKSSSVSILDLAGMVGPDTKDQ